MSLNQVITTNAYNENKRQDEVDKINKAFYGKFNYPWPPLAFYAHTQQQFTTIMLNQDMGSWEHDIVPERPKIWVAGCGTTQALFTALKFPDSEVLGTDLSAESLKICEDSANQLGITNLELEEKSINNVTYPDKFDYIICTGVIHHNADPRVSLDKLSAALQPNGILELMVYNYYHMLFAASYQKAIRMLCHKDSANDAEIQLSTTKKLITNFPVRNLMARYLSSLKNVHDDAELADMLLQPVLHSYTIETFIEMITQSGLECSLPCINQFDKAKGRLTWNMQFHDPETATHYESLPDAQRWQISNLLMMELAPMLWFYLQRKDSSRRRKTEKEVCEEFLNTKFETHSTTLKEYRQDEQGKYRLNPKLISIPAPIDPTDELARKVFKVVNPTICMKDVFHKLKIETSFANVNHLRVNLTTSAFPYLKAVSSEKDTWDNETLNKISFVRNTRREDEDFSF